MLKYLTTKSMMFIKCTQYGIRSFSTQMSSLERKTIKDDQNKSQNLFDMGTRGEDQLTPLKIVGYLDNYVIGQHQAKRAIAVSFRNRWRRKLLNEQLRNQISPKNILIQGPTGTGKTQIARRLAKLTDAPFLKVQATKFTEVGYVGKDVGSMIQDLVKIAINNCKQKQEKIMKNTEQKIKDEVYLQILDSMLDEELTDKETRDNKMKNLKAGDYDEEMVTIIPRANLPYLKLLGFEETYPQRAITRTVKEAKNVLFSTYMQKAKFLQSNTDITASAIKQVEEQGIIFLDEIDKLATPQGNMNMNKGVSTQGVQRDLLPIIQGTVINTKFGDVKTDHILFIGGGAFSMAKVDDLIPELLGRLPIRVQLNPISLQQFQRILTEPEFNLLMQQQNLLKAQKIDLKFSQSSIKKMAEYAYELNKNSENLGARRLHAIVEKIMEQISFDASQYQGQQLTITKQYVTEKLGQIAKTDLSRFLI